MKLLKTVRRLIAGLVSASMLLTPAADARMVLADSDVYSISVNVPDTITAGTAASFTAAITKNGEAYDFDTNEDGLHVYWWCDSLSSNGDGDDSLTSVFTFDEAGEYTDFKVELKDGDYTWLAGDYPAITVSEAASGSDPEDTPDETGYSVLGAPATVTAGEETLFTATFYNNGVEFDPADEGLVISWWSESLNSSGTDSGGMTNTFTYPDAGVYDYDLKVELWDPSDWSTALAGAYVTVTVTEGTSTLVDTDEPYYEAVIEVSPSSPKAGQEVTFEVTLNYVDGEDTTQITDLTDTGITVWFWNNTSGSALDDSTGNTLTNTFTFTAEGDYQI